MIKRIKERIAYRKKVKMLKIFAVNTITNFVVNNGAYINGIQKILLEVNDAENSKDIQNILVKTLESIVEKNKEE